MADAKDQLSLPLASKQLMLSESLRYASDDWPIDEREIPCPPDVDLTNVFSYVTAIYGEPKETALTICPRSGELIPIGGVFDAPPSENDDGHEKELVVVPVLPGEDGESGWALLLQQLQRRDLSQPSQRTPAAPAARLADVIDIRAWRSRNRR